MNIYKEKVHPALKEFFKNGSTDKLIALIKEVQQKLDSGSLEPNLGVWDKEICDEAIGILDNSVYYSTDGDYSNAKDGKKTSAKAKKSFVSDNLNLMLVMALCVPRGEKFNSEQDLTNTSFAHSFYEKSSWFEDLVSGEKSLHGEKLFVVVGEHSEIFSKDEIKEFLKQLQMIEPPKNPEDFIEFSNLQLLLKKSLETQNLTLMLILD